jgi:hypothetical protein
VEATSGDIIKSAPNLRIAFLRQEFVEGLNMDATLRQELTLAFADEQEILRGISAAEVELEQTTDDPKKMEEILDRMQRLQESAIAKGAYSLDSKVNKRDDALYYYYHHHRLYTYVFTHSLHYYCVTTPSLHHHHHRTTHHHHHLPPAGGQDHGQLRLRRHGRRHAG